MTAEQPQSSGQAVLDVESAIESKDVPPADTVKAGRGDRRHWWIVAGIFLLALVVRGIYLYQSAAAPTFESLIVDAGVYHDLAKTLARYHAMKEGFFFQPFFYPFFLAVIYFVAGPSIVVAKIVQIILGSATCSLTYILGRRMLDRGAGILAGVLTAFYGPVIFLECEMMGDWMLGFWSMVLLLLFMYIRQTRSMMAPLALGLCIAISVLTRPTIMPFVLVACICLAWSFYRWGGWSLLIGALRNGLAGFLMLALPVAVASYYKTGNFGILPSSGGINFYIGNNEDTDKTLTIRPGYQWEDLTTWPRREGIVGDQEQQRFYYVKAFEYVRSYPLSFVGGLLGKTVKFLSSREIPRNLDIYMYRQWSPLLSVLAWKVGQFGFPFGAILPLAGVGLVYYWRRLTLEMKLFVFLYPAAVILIFVSGRYRLPVLPAMLILAAGGVFAIADIIRTRQGAALAIAAAGMIALVAVSTVPRPFVEEKVNFAAELQYDLGGCCRESAASLEAEGNRRQAEGFFHQAEEYFRRAVALRPDYVDAWNELGNSILLQNRPDEAIEYYKKALEIHPRLVQAMNNLGVIEYRRGDYAAAMDWLSKCIEVDPTSPKPHYHMGSCLVKTGQPARAVEEFKKSLAYETDLQQIYKCRVAMADALVVAGRPAEAVSEYRDALRFVWERARRISPRQALQNLAWINATSPDPNVRNAVDAVKLANILVEIDTKSNNPPALAVSLDVLAAAYAEAGDFQQAVATATQALTVANAAGKTPLAENIRRRLELYRAGQPYRQVGNELPE